MTRYLQKLEFKEISRVSSKISTSVFNFYTYYLLITFFIHELFNVYLGGIVLISSGMLSFFSLLLVFHNIRYFHKKELITFFLFLITIFFSWFVHKSGLQYIFNLIPLLSTLFLTRIYQLNKSCTMKNCLLFGLVLLFFLFCAPKNGTDSSNILFKINPNTSGLIIFIAIVILSVLKFRNGYLKVSFIVLLFFSQFLYNSRTVIFASIIYLLLLLTNKSKLIQFFKKRSYIVIFVLFVLSLCFAYFYAVILFNLVGRGNLIIMGKDFFSGRQNIWLEAFEQVQKHFIFGIGNTLEIAGYGLGTSIHNQMLGILLTYGFPTMALFVFSFSLLSKQLSINNSRFFFFLICIIMISIFETTLYYNSGLLISFTFIIIMSSTHDNKLSTIFIEQTR